MGKQLKKQKSVKKNQAFATGLQHEDRARIFIDTPKKELLYGGNEQMMYT